MFDCCALFVLFVLFHVWFARSLFARVCFVCLLHVSYVYVFISKFSDHLYVVGWLDRLFLFRVWFDRLLFLCVLFVLFHACFACLLVACFCFVCLFSVSCVCVFFYFKKSLISLLVFGLVVCFCIFLGLYRLLFGVACLFVFVFVSLFVFVCMPFLYVWSCVYVVLCVFILCVMCVCFLLCVFLFVYKYEFVCGVSFGFVCLLGCSLMCVWCCLVFFWYVVVLL